MSQEKSKGEKRAIKVQKRARKQREQAKKQPLGEPTVFLDQFEDSEGVAYRIGSSAIPDRRAIEGSMWRQFGELTAGNDPALNRAQDMMYEAFETDDPDERVSIAREALAVSPDCADALVVLGEEAGSLAEAIRCYEQAVEAGRRAIGDEFEQTVGHFWGVLSTRPYMRARERLAASLWAAGRRDEAVEHHREMLRLNPGDNQGVRYELVSWLIETGHTAELSELFRQFDEDSTHWLYSKALHAFQREGDTAAARGFVKRAVKANRHAPVYVTGQRRLPFESPERYSWGSTEEAIIYARSASGAWKCVPGAIGWLRRVADLGLSDRDEPRPRFNDAKLQKLPLADTECWLVIVRELPASPDHAGDKTFWAVGILTTVGRDFVGTEMVEVEPDAATVWQVLGATMTAPLSGKPRRPAHLEFANEELFAELGDRLKRLGIDTKVTDDADALNQSMAETTNRRQTPPDDRPLTELPQEPDEIWQVDCRQMGIWVPDDDKNTVRPWAVLVTCPTSDTIIGSEIHTKQPSLDEFGDTIEKVMRAPQDGEPRRPGRVHVRSNDQRLSIARRLDAVGVACERSNDLEHWDFVYAGLARHMEGQRKVAPFCELPGVKPAQIVSFFEAAAAYYRSAPWRRTPSDNAVELTCDISKTSWSAVVIGQNGETLGLAMYEEGRGLQQAIDNPDDVEASLEDASALSVTFGEQHEMAPSDLDAAEQFGWPVAAPEAYPIVFRLQPGHELTSPTADELAVLEAALRAIPVFVAGGQTLMTTTVTLSGRTARVTLRPSRR